MLGDDYQIHTLQNTQTMRTIQLDMDIVVHYTRCVQSVYHRRTCLPQHRSSVTFASVHRRTFGNKSCMNSNPSTPDIQCHSSPCRVARFQPLHHTCRARNSVDLEIESLYHMSRNSLSIRPNLTSMDSLLHCTFQYFDVSRHIQCPVHLPCILCVVLAVRHHTSRYSL